MIIEHNDNILFKSLVKNNIVVLPKFSNFEEAKRFFNLRIFRSNIINTKFHDLYTQELFKNHIVFTNGTFQYFIIKTHPRCKRPALYVKTSILNNEEKIDYILELQFN